MNNFQKILFGLVAGLGLAGWLLWWLHHCPVCPTVHQSSTVRVDTIVIHDTVAPSKTKLTKIDKPKSVRTNIVLNCDSIIQAHESFYQFQTDLSDSMMDGWIKQTISKDRIIFTDKHFTYRIPHVIDSIIQYVDRPTFRSTFTAGCFMGKNSTGLAIGYRTQRIHATIGWDLTNGSPVVGFNYDLR